MPRLEGLKRRIGGPAKLALSLAALLMMSVAARAASTGSTTMVWRSDKYIILAPAGPLTAAEAAAEYLHDPGLAWWIEDENGASFFRAGDEVIIPLAEPPPLGVFRDEYQMVPVLCYHQFGKQGSGKLQMGADEFERQMAYLKQQHFRVIPLSRLEEFLNGTRALPRHAVVITIDDGYQSFYDIAFPILNKYGYPATIFIYSDWVGAGSGALTWEEIKTMETSGLIDTESHTKSHTDLTTIPAGSADKLRGEILVPVDLIARRLSHPAPYLAYPYGKTDQAVINQLREARIRLALTVDKGSNAFFASPWSLRRTMIFAGEDLGKFIKTLQDFERITP